MDPPGSPYALRRARPADLQALIAMETSAFTGDRLSARSFRRHVESPRADLIVTAQNGEIAGYALNFYRANSTLARLYSIAVDETHRGRGLSSRMIGDLERKARQRGCDRLRLEVRIDNDGAIAAYEHMGFRPIGRIARYYEDGQTALRMEKSLHSPTARLAA